MWSFLCESKLTDINPSLGQLELLQGMYLGWPSLDADRMEDLFSLIQETFEQLGPHVSK